MTPDDPTRFGADTWQRGAADKRRAAELVAAHCTPASAAPLATNGAPTPLSVALDTSCELSPSDAHTRADNLLTYLGSLNPALATEADARGWSPGSRLCFIKVLGRFQSLTRVPEISLGAFPERDRRTGALTSAFAQVKLTTQPDSPYPVPVFLALQKHLKSLTLCAQPSRFTFHTSDGDPVHTPFKESWANSLLNHLNGAK